MPKSLIIVASLLSLLGLIGLADSVASLWKNQIAINVVAVYLPAGLCLLMGRRWAYIWIPRLLFAQMLTMLISLITQTSNATILPVRGELPLVPGSGERFWMYFLIVASGLIIGVLDSARIRMYFEQPLLRPRIPAFILQIKEVLIVTVLFLLSALSGAIILPISIWALINVAYRIWPK